MRLSQKNEKEGAKKGNILVQKKQQQPRREVMMVAFTSIHSWESLKHKVEGDWERGQVVQVSQAGSPEGLYSMSKCSSFIVRSVVSH